MNLSDMTWDELMDLRMQAGKDIGTQQRLAPFEHRAWARETVGQNPLMALPFAAMIPGYQAAKAVGLLQSDDPKHPTTGPSWEQFKQGFTGVGEGLLNWYNK
jgi:hypothetical protein